MLQHEQKILRTEQPMFQSTSVFFNLLCNIYINPHNPFKIIPNYLEDSSLSNYSTSLLQYGATPSNNVSTHFKILQVLHNTYKILIQNLKMLEDPFNNDSTSSN